MTVAVCFYSPAWQCPLCNTSYDNQEIEHLLIDVVNRKTMAYMLQDLQCNKCLQVTVLFNCLILTASMSIYFFYVLILLVFD